MKETIKTRFQLKEWLSYEHKNYGNVSGLRYFFSLGEPAILWKHQKRLRETEYLINSGHKFLALFSRIRLDRIQNRYGIHIPLNCCGKGLKLMHVGPIIVNDHAILGNDCCLHVNVGIVAGGSNGGTPVIGNYVVIGYGAVVLGQTYVADGVAVGANAVVNKDVLEPNIAVAGIPAKKISNHGRSYWAKYGKTVPMS